MAGYVRIGSECSHRRFRRHGFTGALKHGASSNPTFCRPCRMRNESTTAGSPSPRVSRSRPRLAKSSLAAVDADHMGPRQTDRNIATLTPLEQEVRRPSTSALSGLLHGYPQVWFG